MNDEQQVDTDPAASRICWERWLGMVLGMAAMPVIAFRLGSPRDGIILWVLLGALLGAAMGEMTARLFESLTSQPGGEVGKPSPASRGPMERNQVSS